VLCVLASPPSAPPHRNCARGTVIAPAPGGGAGAGTPRDVAEREAG
jgi:hypothetical protein